jgi:hypothetical protein
MRNLELKTANTLALTLAADARLSKTDYCNDMIWELVLSGGESPTLALQTTFGLRARNLRIFPRLIYMDQVQSDPAGFANPVSIQRYYPNYLKLSCAPFANINVEIEYWVPGSQGIAGRTRVVNSGEEPISLNLEWVSVLSPTIEGQRMALSEIGGVNVLAGRTENLCPVFFLTGGPQPGNGPYPSLAIKLDLAPNEARFITWTQATLSNTQASFDAARQIAARNWDAEFARIELSNLGQVEIQTGDPDWDTAFALTQTIAYHLFMQSTGYLPNPSIVSTRQPDQGFSLRGDGSDYNHLWNGQTPLEVYYISSLLLPASPELVKGLLENFFASQGQDGFIDWKPGLGGQRSQMLSTPMLVNLSWHIYQVTQDLAFLERIFPKLLAFIQTWFSPQHDRDGDGIPEWDHALQTGFEEHPLFAYWHPWSQGVDITTVECPDLCSFLYLECQTLIRIAKEVNRPETISALEALAENLKTAVEAAWDETTGSYLYWDRESHHSISFEVLGTRQGPGEISIQREFLQPIRPLIYIDGPESITRSADIFIHGSAPSGGHRVERIPADRVRWLEGKSKITSERIYSALEYVEIQGIHEQDMVTVRTVGHDFLDQTLLLPLWAGIPELGRAKSLIKRTLTNPKRFWSAYGLRSCLTSHEGAEKPVCNTIYPPWNQIIGEGLIRYGFQAKAGELTTRLMKAIIKTLKQDGGFRNYYDAKTGQGGGERNALSGLAPIGLFLEALGVYVMTPQRVRVSGTNPFPWTVTIKYRGLTILRQKNKTMVIFPDGQNITVRNGKSQVITLE